MAYKRSFNRRTRRGRRNRRSRNTIFNYNNPTVRMAYKALQTANYIRGLINVEFKRYDTNTNLAIAPDTPTLTALSSPITQGDDVSQRNGRSILAKSIYLTGYINLGDDIPNCIYRVIVFYSKSTDGIYPTAASLLSYPTNITSPLNPEYAGNRYIVLSDKRYQLDQENNPKQWVKIYRKLPQNHHLVWADATANTPVSGHIYMLTICDHNSIATTTIGFQYVTRLMFIDN